ncbi:hypothetical protein C8F04DRAFT_1258029 [Mycena alexandri]|uniref:Uncharacterized protein n=1 Tax=Mycena alexandri TaxID=1745969 RepID=A0AAD6T0Z0_9AGAR|nr:hypothetical protein C8F04DRAFT_1258029 [Mycena alexandri]
MTAYYLPARVACLLCACQGTFFQSNLSPKPTLPTDACVCGHHYHNHQLSLNPDPHNPNQAMARGINPAMNCGGFLAPIVPPWQPNAFCSGGCDSPWFHHADLGQGSAASVRDNPFPMNPVPSSSNPFTAAHGPPPLARSGLAHPASIYRSTAPPPRAEFRIARPIPDFHAPEPDRGSVASMRNRSRMDNLPQHTTSRAALGPRSTIASGAAAGPSTHNPFTTTTTVRSSTNKKPSKTKPTQRTYVVIMLPFCHGDPEDPLLPSPEYRFHTRKVTRPLMTALDAHHLVFQVTLNVKQKDYVWADLDAAIHTHCDTHGLVLAPDPESPDPGDFDHAQWVAVCTRTPDQEKRCALKPVQWYEYAYTEDELYRACKNVPHPKKADLVLLFIEPLFGNIRGPLPTDTEPSLAHRCYAFVVWCSLNFQKDFEDEPTCFPACTSVGYPDSALLQIDQPSGSRSRSSSLGSEPPTNRRRLSAPENYIHDDGDSDKTPPPSILGHLQRSIQPSVPAVTSVAEIQGLYSWQRATGLDLVGWIDKIIRTIDPATPSLNILGPSAESIGRTLCSLIRYNGIPGAAFTPEPGVTCVGVVVVPDVGLLMPGRSYTITRDPNDPLMGAQGNGPERTIHMTTLDLRTSDDRWVESVSGAFKRPNFDGLADPDSFYVDGRYAAITILRMEAGPMPMSPFLIFAAMQADRSVLNELTLPFINTLDPGSAKILRDWFNVGAADTFTQPDHPAVQLLAHYLEIEADWFTHARTVDEHRDVHARLLEAFFFGRSDIWGIPGFEAFRKGLRLPLADPPNDYAPAPSMGLHWASAHTVLRFLPTLYDRRVKNAQEVISLLRLMVVPGLTPDPTGPAALYAQIFCWRLWRWLKGLGYPEELVGVYITAEEYAKQRTSSTLRAAHLLYCLTESWTLPASPSTTLSIDLHIDPQEGFDEQRSAPIFWHSCTRVAEIYFNPWLKNVLQEPGDLEETETVYRFDLWMSKMTSLRGGDYNRI